MFFRAIFTNSFGILLSRVLGFIRDILTASALGASIYSDIFFVAFKLPNLFRRIFGEGAFAQSFIPAFASAKYKSVFSYYLFVRFLGAILILSLIVTIFSPFFTKLMAIGFDEDTIKIAAPFVAWNFYYLILIFIATFMAAILQYKNRFAVASFSTSLLNISMIGALVLSISKEPLEIVWNLTFGVLVGGFLQVVAHLIALKKLGLCKIFIVGFFGRKTKQNKIQKDKEGYFPNFLNAIWGNSTAQVAAFLDTWLASFLAFGSISYLYYANRVFQLPLALFAIATSVAIFPRVARYLKNSNEAKALEILKNSFWFLFFLLSFSTVGGVILSEEIVKLLFERGAFGQMETKNTAMVLSMYMIGLLPFGLSKIFSLWIYSQQNQKLAAKIATVSLLTNVFLSIILILPFGAAGLALSGSIGGVVQLILTLKAFGMGRFLDIIRDKLWCLFIFSIGFEIAILMLLKDFINGNI